MYFQNFYELKSNYNRIQKTGEWLVFLSDLSVELLSELQAFCKEKTISLMGGIFPGLLVHNEYKQKGLIVLPIQTEFKTKVFPYMMRRYENKTMNNKTAIVLSDGLSPYFKVLTNTLYNQMNKDVHYIGGGAGYRDLKHRPCIFDENGLYKNVMMVMVINQKSKISYQHGWNRVAGPYKANLSYDNLLLELNEKKAFLQYKELYESQNDTLLSKENFLEHSKKHPLGIPVEGNVDVVRDLISVNEEDEIICVANIPEGSDVYLLEANADTLLDASEQVANDCLDHSFEHKGALLFDCITRAMYLEEKFDEELLNIFSIINLPVYGALSIGELSHVANGELQIHNKSVVLGVIEGLLNE